jgi:hypothetical protein
MIQCTLDQVPTQHTVVMLMVNQYCIAADTDAEETTGLRAVTAGTWLEIFPDLHGRKQFRVIGPQWDYQRFVEFPCDHESVWVAY